MTTGIEHLVNQQILRWEQGAHEGRGVEERSDRQRAMIALSREHMGALGARIAERIAQQLGFTVYDSRLVEEIAKTAHIRRRLVETLDGHVQDSISEYIVQAFSSGSLTTSEYLHYLSRVVLTLGRHGRGLIVGRGAHYILDPGETLRLRLVAPLELRIVALVDERGLASDEARAEILRVDAERYAFCRRHYNRDVRDPGDYDLVLNLAQLPPEACADLAAAAFRLRFARR